MPTKQIIGTLSHLWWAWLLLFVCGMSVSWQKRGRAIEPSQWPVELQVGRFQIHADFQVSEQSRLIPELLTLTEDIRRLLDLPAGERRVHVVLFGTAAEYQRYMQNYFPSLPARRAMFIQDRGPGMLFAHWHSDVAVDLRHEITHALLNDTTYPLPLWLDEGLAEYFEIASAKRFAKNPYIAETARRAAAGHQPKLYELETISDLQTFDDAHYRDSWSWVHFLLHRNASTRQLLTRYIADYRAGSASVLPLSRQLSQTLPDAEAEFAAHFAALVTVEVIAN